MAVKFNGTTDQLSYSGSLPPVSSVLTIIVWAKRVAAGGGFSCITRISNIVSIINIAVDDGANTVGWYTGGGSITPGFVMPLGVWCRFAAVNAGGSGTLYLATATGPVTVATGTVSGGNPTLLGIGGRGAGDDTEPWNGPVAGWKAFAGWTPTLPDIEAEWSQLAPLRTTGLVAAYPLRTPTPDGLLDASGSGRTLGMGVTPATTEDDPPVPLILPRQRLVLSTTGDASVSGSDSATVTETSSIAITVSDQGVLAENATGAAAVPAADAAAITDTVVLAVALAGTDSAAVADTTGLLAALVALDSLTGAELSALTASLTRTDTAVTADTASLDTGEAPTRGRIVPVIRRAPTILGGDR